MWVGRSDAARHCLAALSSGLLGPEGLVLFSFCFEPSAQTIGHRASGDIFFLYGPNGLAQVEDFAVRLQAVSSVRPLPEKVFFLQPRKEHARCRAQLASGLSFPARHPSVKTFASPSFF